MAAARILVKDRRERFGRNLAPCLSTEVIEQLGCPFSLDLAVWAAVALKVRKKFTVQVFSSVFKHLWPTLRWA